MQAQTSESVLTADTIEPTIAEAQRAAPMDPRESEALVERARQVSRYGMPRPNYRERRLPMTRQQFIELHGGPPLILKRNCRTEYLPDGATMSSNGVEQLYFPPPTNPQDRLMHRASYVKRLLHLTEQELRTIQTMQANSGPSSSARYQIANRQWNRELFGAPPLTEDQQLDFTVAIENLTDDVAVLRRRFDALREQLRQLNPAIVLEDRYTV